LLRLRIENENAVSGAFKEPPIANLRGAQVLLALALRGDVFDRQKNEGVVVVDAITNLSPGSTAIPSESPIRRIRPLRPTVRTPPWQRRSRRIRNKSIADANDAAGIEQHDAMA